ncbi:MAG: DEAD/DEAH box helicase [Gammaproteobacteria bacterium]
MNDDLLANFSAKPVLKQLHGFQRDAVEHAFERLYRAPDSSQRFLIADEVGLGKTMIARGILAKALEEMRDDIDRIDVVYICSNLSIAAQNINRLNPLTGLEFSGAERITLLPVTLKDLADRKVNFVSFTPGTSLDLKGNMGKARERMLLYVLLKEFWALSDWWAPVNVFQGNVRNTDRFRRRLARFQAEHDISTHLAEAFHKRILDRDEELEARGEETLQDRFLWLCRRFRRSDVRIDQETRQERNTLIGELRVLLAEVCIDALEPDLIILDEFQRFKHLLSADSEAGELASRLFEWSDAHAVARVLLLSATPYKAYTLRHELDEDDHYADFIRTVDFLQNDRSKNHVLRDLFIRFRKEMYALPKTGGEPLVATRKQIESELRKVMSRTERLASSDVENGMLRPITDTSLPLEEADLNGYKLLQHIGSRVGAYNNIEYWKFSAYPLNFMETYKLKTLLKEAVSIEFSEDALNKEAMHASGGLIDFKSISRYDAIPLSNAKTRNLVNDLKKYNAFGILWLPPSAPSYALSGDYAKAAQAGITKRLVFSSWHLVPRSLAALLSYESERQVFHRDEENPLNTAEARRLRRGLLRFSVSDDRLTGLTVFTLLYPSRVLAELCDPRIFARGQGDINHLPDAILAWAEDRIREKLSRIVHYADADEAPDESWYWAAPLILERESFAHAVNVWWRRVDVADIWSGEVLPEEERSSDTGWQAHVAHARPFALGKRRPQGPAPRDLPRILALIALAGPATCALRGLLSLYPAGPNKGLEQRKAASRIAWGFRSLFNRPESMALVRQGNRDTPYWRLCLQHALGGGLSSVMNEYIHVLRDACGLTVHGPEKACPEIAETALSALNIRTASLDVDDLYQDDESKQLVIEKRPMRSLFAMRFGSNKAEEQGQVQRDVAVRSAFNSPFWPFVLASTSIGQEGLDFHWYCHAIVHWNLPANPVELEQREGRVHRFKGHAIRKNIAMKYLLQALESGEKDLWYAMFRLAAESVRDDSGGLIPYWLYQMRDGAWVERHVPMYPLSKDVARYADLRRSLGAYRMVFGQPRQDELLEYLFDRIEPGKMEMCVENARIDLSPPHTKKL